MLISTKLVIFLVILWGGTISLPAFIFCRGHYLVNDISELDENPNISNGNLSVPQSDSHINNFSLVENSKYENFSSIMEICIIPSSQIKMKTEIGACLFYSRSLIIRTLITVILAIPGLIKNSKFLDYRDFLLIIYRNTTIPIIKNWEFF